MPLSAPRRNGTPQVPQQMDRRERAANTAFINLTSLVVRDVGVLIGRRDALVETVIAEAIRCFVVEQGFARPAAARVAPLLWELGERHTCRGLGSHMLDLGFQHARNAVQRALQLVGVPPLSEHGEHSWRRELAPYLDLLHRQAVSASERARAVLQADDHRRSVLGSVLLNSGQIAPTPRLLRAAGIEPETEYVLVVSPSEEMPRALFDHAGVVAGAHPHEALMPAADLHDVMADAGPRQVVVGPPGPVSSLAQTAETVRRCAQLLRVGRAADPRPVVQCADHLSELVTDGVSGLSKLLAAKHLAPLETLGHPRRVRDGRLLLQWLVLGQPINQVARSLGIPPQTAHNRLNRLRSLYGDALDDPTQRFELMAALQAALPRWQEAAEPGA